jgi:hypothetical protein
VNAFTVLAGHTARSGGGERANVNRRVDVGVVHHHKGNRRTHAGEVDCRVCSGEMRAAAGDGDNVTLVILVHRRGGRRHGRENGGVARIDCKVPRHTVTVSNGVNRNLLSAAAQIRDHADRVVARGRNG